MVTYSWGQEVTDFIDRCDDEFVKYLSIELIYYESKFTQTVKLRYILILNQQLQLSPHPYIQQGLFNNRNP